MKYYTGLLAVLLVTLVSVIVMTSHVSAEEPGCYAQLGPGRAKVECDDIKAFYPEFQPDPTLCYVSSGGTQQVNYFTEPEEFDCGNDREFNSQLPSEEAAAAASSPAKLETTLETGRADIACGGGGDYGQVNLSFDIGCRQKGNPIIDMLFAIIRIITTGVGIALVASIIIAGVEYTTASGDPNKTSLAKKRLVSTLLVALPFYLLTYAILNWLIPLAVF